MALECLNQNTNEVRTALLIITVDPRELSPGGWCPRALSRTGLMAWIPGGTGRQFFVSGQTPALPAPGAEPLIGAMGIFSLTCAGTGHGELNGNS